MNILNPATILLTLTKHAFSWGQGRAVWSPEMTLILDKLEKGWKMNVHVAEIADLCNKQTSDNYKKKKMNKPL